MAKIVNLFLRATEFIWSLLIMSLIGNMIAQAVGGDTSSVNYAMFCAVVSMVSLIYLIPATFNEDWAFHPLLMPIIDTLNALFFLCGGIALAAALHVHSCSNHHYLDTNHVTDGTAPHNRSKRCKEAQASTAFLWFGFASFAASAVLSFLESRGGANMRAPRRGGPSVSRV